MHNPTPHTSKVSVIGLGKLGSPMAACFAAKGFHTTGVDLDAAKVNAINDGIAPVYETHLQEMIALGRERLKATHSIQEAVLNSDITFVIVPTPSEPDGSFSLRYVIPCFEAIGEALCVKRTFHIVVLSSTVLPGATGQQLQPMLERVSGLRVGVDFGLCYNPEFIALGNVVHNLLNPDFILIGESDSQSGDMLAEFYKQFCDNTPAVARMNFINAELTKLAVNTFVTTKISFANMLARICERLPQADVNVVTSALGLDTRIGPKYLKGAIGYGGPCFPRDNRALSRLAHSIGAPATIAESTDLFNRGEVSRLVELIENRLPRNGASTIAVLGLAYKPDTDVVDESQGLLLAEALAASNCNVVVYDPVALDNARGRLGDKVHYAKSLEDCVAYSDVLIITTPWQAFKALQPQQVARDARPRLLIDCWRILDRRQFDTVVDYVALGLNA